MRVVFVHGACVRDGAWWWQPAAEILQQQGVSSHAPALPSCGEGDRPAGPDGPGLAEDVVAVRQLLTTSDEPTVVVAHSYGGIVTAEAAAGLASVRHLLLVSSYLPEPGESLATFAGQTPSPFLDADPEGGTFGARPELFVETFAQDCSPEVGRAGRERLVRQSLSVAQHPVSAAAWHDVPSTYLVCSEDRGTSAAAQRAFAQRARNVVEVAAGHHPFLSQPATVAELVLSLA